MASIINDFDNILEKIYLYLYQRKFNKIEKIILQIINESIFLKKDCRERKCFLNFFSFLHQDFNPSYLKWVKKQNGDIKKEISELSNPYHDNFLFGHTRCPASFDDLICEVKLFLQNHCDRKQIDNLKYNLSCYNKLKQ